MSQIDKTSDTGNAECQKDVKIGKKHWQQPAILTVEPLEAAAATCFPPAGGYGKDSNSPLCGTLGS